MFDWVQDHPVIVWAFVGASLLVSLASVLAMPAVLVRIPEDYFAQPTRPPGAWAHRHPMLRLAHLIAKNLLGWLFVIAGIMMLVIPGQGLLTMIVGFLLLDFSGKYRVEKWLVSREWVKRPINWLRRRKGRPPLQTAS